MDMERIRDLRQEAVRLEGQARTIAGELTRLDEMRGELRGRYEDAVEELQRILAEMAEAIGAEATAWPVSGCAWCGARLPADADEGEVCEMCVRRHGIERVDHLPHMTADEADALPYGVIQVDEGGMVVGFNRAEQVASGRRRERVLGRNFFRDVAPCTSVKDFEGRYRVMVARGEPAREAFRYVFRLTGKDRLVGISLRYDPALERGIIAVVPLDEERAA